MATPTPEAAAGAARVAHVVLDFGMVSGADASATVSLAKLRNLCHDRQARLAYCSLADRINVSERMVMALSR